MTAHERRARIGLPELGRSILARRVIRRRPFCVTSWSASRSVQLAEVQDRVALRLVWNVRSNSNSCSVSRAETGGRDEATSRAREFAAELFASNNTVRTHLRHIYAKLDAHSRSEAVARAAGARLMAERPPVVNATRRLRSSVSPRRSSRRRASMSRVRPTMRSPPRPRRIRPGDARLSDVIPSTKSGSSKPETPPRRGFVGVPEEGLEPPTRGL
jgi:hypothetical protein